MTTKNGFVMLTPAKFRLIRKIEVNFPDSHTSSWLILPFHGAPTVTFIVICSAQLAEHLALRARERITAKNSRPDLGQIESI